MSQDQISNQENITVSACSSCQGTGVRGSERCADCVGAGFFGQHAARRFVWSYPLSRGHIAHRHLETIIDRLIAGFLFVIGLSGLGAFVWLFYKLGPIEIWQALWQTDQPALVLLWSSLVADLFLVARLERQAERYQDVIDLWQAPPTGASPKAIDCARAFTDEALFVLERAYGLAVRLQHAQLTPLHVLAAALSTRDAHLVLFRLEISSDDAVNKIRSALGRLERGSGPPSPSPEFRALPLRAYAEAARNRQTRVWPLEVLVAGAIGEPSPAQDVLQALDVNLPRLQNVARWQQLNRQLLRQWKQARRQGHLRRNGMIDRAMTAIATPFLDRVSEDMTLAAKVGAIAPVVGREHELAELFQILEGGHAGVVLIGEPGVGTSALLAAVAQRMLAEEVPAVLHDKRLVRLDIPALIAGASAPGELEQRLELVLRQLVQAGNVVIAIDHLHNLVGVGSAPGKTLDLTEMVAEAMERYGIKLIATTTPEAWRARLDGHSSLVSHLETLKIEELESAAAIPVLEARAGQIEYQHQVFLSYRALESAAIWAQRYLHQRRLPTSALELLTEAASLVRARSGKASLVRQADVAAVIAEKTHIPAAQVSADESAKLLHLEDSIHERLIDQVEAVRAVSAALRRSRVELRDAQRPIASFLFLGPTGVGKTQLAKALARVYFGAAERMVRLDMSEYQDANSAVRLIGSSEGHSGHLTSAIYEQPFSLLLLDEFEKAHPDILNLFLQVLDDGRLTDGAGRTVDFTNTIIIATSNAGAEYIQDAVRAKTSFVVMKERLLRQELRGIFRPELLNRFDELIVFAPLGSEEISAIARLLLAEVTNNLDTKGIAFRVSDQAIVELGQVGFDPQFGARPLRRLIQDRIESPIADLLLAKKADRRDVIILEPGLTLRVEKANEL